jgi:hypothetical protein
MPSFDNKVEFNNAHCSYTSELAIRVEADWYIGPRRFEWIPKSQIDDDSEVWKEGQDGTLVISEWIAMQKALV